MKSPNPIVTQRALIRLNESQNKTRGQESEKGTGDEEGVGKRQERSGGASVSGMQPCRYEEAKDRP